jgi:uncharacterized membrane protein YfcA
MIRATKFLRNRNLPSTLTSFTESTSNMTPFKKVSFISVLTGASMGAVCGMYTGLNSTLNDAKLDKGRWTRNNKDRTLKEQFQDYGMNPVVGGFLGFLVGGIAGAFTVTFSPIILPLASYGIYYDIKKKE